MAGQHARNIGAEDVDDSADDGSLVGYTIEAVKGVTGSIGDKIDPRVGRYEPEPAGGIPRRLGMVRDPRGLTRSGHGAAVPLAPPGHAG